VASDYYDLFKVNVAQFAYLKCPKKIRAAVINAGGPTLSEDVVRGRLARLPSKIEGARVGEPKLSDAVDYRVPGLVRSRQAPRPVVRSITPEERAHIAELVKSIGDKPKQPGAPYRYVGPKPTYGRTSYADLVVAQVCEAMEIPHEVFFSLTRQKYVVAARSLVVKLLRERNPAVYSYPRIAEIVGRNDHSTMIHAYQQFDNYCRMIPRLAEAYAQLREGGE
jgi:hypothetical protein